VYGFTKIPDFEFVGWKGARYHLYFLTK